MGTRLLVNCASIVLFCITMCLALPKSMAAAPFPPSWQLPPTTQASPFDIRTTSQYLKICVIGGPQTQEPLIVGFDAPALANSIVLVQDGVAYDQIWSETRRIELPQETTLFAAGLASAGATGISQIKVGIVTGTLPFADCDYVHVNILTHSYKYQCADGGNVDVVYGLPLSRSASDVEALYLADLAFSYYEDLLDWWIDSPFPMDTLPSGAPMPTNGGVPSTCVEKLGPRPTTEGIDDPCDFAAAKYAQCMWDARCKYLRELRKATATTRRGLIAWGGGVLSIFVGGVAAVCTGGLGAPVAVPLIVGGAATAFGVSDTIEGARQIDEELQIYTSAAAACFKELYPFFQLCE